MKILMDNIDVAPGLRPGVETRPLTAYSRKALAVAIEDVLNTGIAFDSHAPPSG